MEQLKRLIREIHRRSLWQILAIYVAASWAVFEVVQTVSEGLGLPPWFPPFAALLLLIGLPVVLATAFVQEGMSPSRRQDPTLVPTAGPQTELDKPGPEPAGPKEAGPVRRLLTWRNAIAGGVLALALWGVVAAGWLLVRGTPGDESAASLSVTEGREPTLAVLPFENLSPDEENAYFAAGIHEDILAHLSRVEDLTVLARTSVLPYQDSEKGIRQIAAELNADAVLEGSVRRARDEIRVVAQLIDPGTEGHLWAETYDRRLDDIFAVQTQIAQRVARALEATLTPEEEQRIEKRPTESLAAYDLYLKGREAYNRYEEEENDEAIRLFRRALELDPEYALAWAGLGDAFAQRVGRFGYPLAWADSAVRAARRAVELDPELAEAHKALGLAYQMQGRHHEALDAYLEAIELDPNHYGAMNNAGLIYRDFGRLDKAMHWYRRAVRLGPNDPIPRLNLAYTFTFLKMEDRAREWLDGLLVLDPQSVQGRILPAVHAVYRGATEEAIARAEELVEDDPDNASTWTVAAGVVYMARDFERAAEYARESLRLKPDNSHFYWHRTRTLLALSLLGSGDGTRGREVLRQAMEAETRSIEEGSDDWDARWDLAAAHAALGDREAALDWLERAYDTGFRLARWAKTDPAFDDFRDDPNYREILERMDAELSAMRERVIREEQAAELQ